MQRMTWSVLVSRLLLGALTLGFGMLVGLDRLGLVTLGPIQNLWPLAVLAGGLVFFAETPGHGVSLTGLWLVALGAWLVMNQLVGSLLGHWFAPLGNMLLGAWPLLVMVAGAGMSLHTLIVMASSGVGRAAPATPLVTSRFAASRFGASGLTSTGAVREGRNGR